MCHHLIITKSLFKLCQVHLENGVLLWQNQHNLNQSLVTKTKLNLLRIIHDNQIFYQSSIPLFLTNYYRINPVKIAEELYLIFQGQNQLFFKVKIKDSQLLFYPSNFLIANYLENLTKHSYFKIYFADYFQLKNQSIIAFKYLKDRCDQLLNLAQETKLISSSQEYNLLREGQLIFTDPAELELIEKLIMIIDSPDQLKKIDAHKILKSLGQSWLNFHAKCQIWGHLSPNNLNLVQGRLKLIALTQFVFQWFLQNHDSTIDN